MKKLIAFIFLMTMLCSSLLMLASCGGGGTDEPETPEEGGLTAEELDYQELCNWDRTVIRIRLPENSTHGLTPYASRRYLSGESDDFNLPVDEEVRARNAKSELVTNTKIEYSYDIDTNRAIGYWYGQFYAESLFDKVDIVVYNSADIIALVLSGAACDLKSSAMNSYEGESFFEFAKEDYDPVTDDEGYMWNYMSDLSLDVSTFILSSDYLLDNYRSTGVVPVNLAVLESLDCSGSALDKNSDGKITGKELYQTVFANGWNFANLKNLYALADASGKGGFSIGNQASIDARGLVYSQNIELTMRSDGGILPLPECPEAFKNFGTALSDLITSDGVKLVTSAQIDGKLRYSFQIIQDEFLAGYSLFGGITTIASLETPEYDAMREAGTLGVLPVPRYSKYDKETDANGYYGATSVSNSFVAIILNKSQCKKQCAAWLNYQTITSDKVMDAYFASIVPDDENVEKVLRMMRAAEGVVSDYEYINGVKAMYNQIPGNHLPTIISNSKYEISGMDYLYDAYVKGVRELFSVLKESYEKALEILKQQENN